MTREEVLEKYQRNEKNLSPGIMNFIRYRNLDLKKKKQQN